MYRPGQIIRSLAISTLVTLSLTSCGSSGNSGGPMGVNPPPGAAVVNFTFDDSANRTYTIDDGLAWKGSFSFNATTRVLKPNASWAGPFPMLYDDGSWNTGGHEPTGAVAGDHVWGVAVFVEATSSDQTFEYGVIRGSTRGSDGEWIWNGGANGTFTVLADDTAEVDADGMVVAPFGEIDMRITLDVSQIDPEFGNTDPTDVRIKSSAWRWHEITLYDVGEAGDEIPGDGIYTLQLSQQIGPNSDLPHDGLIHSGQEVQFDFVLDGVEYRVGGVASTSGVDAAFLGPNDESWGPVLIDTTDLEGNAQIVAPVLP